MLIQFVSLIIIFFASNLLPINFLYAQDARKPLKYKINEKGDTTFFIVDTQPEFVGGTYAMYKFLAMNIRYPASSREEGAMGTVYVGFVIDCDGSIKEVESKKMVKTPIHSCDSLRTEIFISDEHYKALETESVRVIQSMPHWKAGMINGRPVKVAWSLPIKFHVE